MATPTLCRACKARHDPMLTCSRAKRLAEYSQPPVAPVVVKSPALARHAAVLLRPAAKAGRKKVDATRKPAARGAKR